MQVWQNTFPCPVHVWEAGGGCWQPAGCHLPGEHEQVAVAAGQHAATEPHWRIPHLHHDDQQLHC